MEEKKKRTEEEEIIKNIRNLFKLKKEIKGYLNILRIFLSMKKKKKIILNQ